MTSADFSYNLERFTGFAAVYDHARPSPPAILADLLRNIAQTDFPDQVVDLGCGTGLSTRYWIGRAKSVIGIEPTDSMRDQAESQGGENVSYRKAFSDATGLAENSTDIVTCAQSLHWMNPSTTFHEAARILRPGGVFAAYDYDWPPVTGSWLLDATYDECMTSAHVMEKKAGILERLQRWEKAGHLSRMRESGAFRYCREITVHHLDHGNAERLVALFLSQGHVQSLLKIGHSPAELQLDRLRETAIREIGNDLTPWTWSSRVRLGIV